MTTSLDVRSSLVDLLRLDLIGPELESPHAHEVLSQPPSRWYLTGFLVPSEAPADQRIDRQSDENIEQVEGDGARDDAAAPEKGAARQAFFPSSMGLSVLLPPEATALDVLVTWGDYVPIGGVHDQVGHDDPDRPPASVGSTGQGIGDRTQPWQRTPGRVPLSLTLPHATERPIDTEVPGSRGLKLVTSVRPISALESGIGGRLSLVAGTRSVSVFLVNGRAYIDGQREEAFAFQAAITLKSRAPFISRPARRGYDADDADEPIADLQYRDVGEYAVGHGVASHATAHQGRCHEITTTWMPSAEVERVAASNILDVTLGMEAIAAMTSAGEIKAKLGGIASLYTAWIAAQRLTSLPDPGQRVVADELLSRAEGVCRRIQDGLAVLEDPLALDAFRIANQAMATAARRRGKDMYKGARVPSWRPFQLAFILMNLRGIAEPTHFDREIVDLLFFPTGGGKTEAYLGLSAFTLLLRRLRNPTIGSAGLSVLMRYTLRLLTLDQTGRAATLICALELIRRDNIAKLGPWPFEIGLWVGLAATPNHMGRKGEKDKSSARARTLAFQDDDRRNPPPIPLESCPWCGEKFRPRSFSLQPHADRPLNLRILCFGPNCVFRGDKALPIVAVDDPIYRRLPCFLIATVDKFASLPWVGQTGALFGKVQRHDAEGFYGPSDPNHGNRMDAELPPPDLIIQDELHLISGPLGTMVGLYETAIDALASRPGPDPNRPIRPKVIASTATVRRAKAQIEALFTRSDVEIFPPPGPDRHDSFFAHTESRDAVPGRLYLGIAAQGRSLKVALLRAYLALMAGAQRAYEDAGGGRNTINPADPYMTLVGYFNSLRELGGSRRIVEDEVSSRLYGYDKRRRDGETPAPFAKRKINVTELVELTSRVHTSKVAEAKERLARPYAPDDKARVDVALATNMISVGLDITRLGLMVVLGQPKTTAEYIQATSRVGREEKKPGLVIALLNIHRPRDRSHYERFEAYHETFYRSVEATSVTPFSPRAVDRGIAAVTVALARHGDPRLTAPLAAADILTERPNLGFVVDTFGRRAERQPNTNGNPVESRDRVRGYVTDLLDEWTKLAALNQSTAVGLQYQHELGEAPPLLHDALEPLADRVARRFRARRSLRDVEPSVDFWMKTLDGADVDTEEHD